MKVALVSIDPVALGCARASRNLAIYQLAAYARHNTAAAACRFYCFDRVLENFGGKSGPCDETRRLASELLERDYDVVGFSTKIWNFYHVRNVARLLKTARPSTVVICGGYQVQGDRFPPLMLAPDEPFDFLVTGEGEEPFLHLLQFLLGFRPIEACRAIWFREADGRPALSGPPVQTDLSRLPSTFGQDEHADFDGRLIVLEASRGCPYQCHFCEWAATSNRVLPLDRVFAELDYVLERGATRIIYADGTFNLDRVRRFHPILEHMIVEQRRMVSKRGDDAAYRGQVVLELRPELITDRCAELLEEVVSLFPDTFYQFGLQTTDDRVGRLVARPYHERKWNSALERLGPRSRMRTGIDIIADLPGNSLSAVAESTRVALRLGVQSATFRLHVLPGTPLERNASALQLDFDPFPPHLVERWGDHPAEELTHLVAFGMMCSFLGNELLTGWTELERSSDEQVNFATIMLGFDDWLRSHGLSGDVYGHLHQCFGANERTPDLYVHKTWIAAHLPVLFGRFCTSEAFRSLAVGSAIAGAAIDSLIAHVELWNVQLMLADLEVDNAMGRSSHDAGVNQVTHPAAPILPASVEGLHSR